MKEIKTNLLCKNKKIAIAIAKFNYFINKNLLNGAIDTLKNIGQIKDENITVVWLPGSYEIPMIVKTLLKTKKYDGIIALGSVIKGKTLHYKYIFQAVSIGLSNIILNNDIPVSLGILITKTIEEAIERSGIKTNYGIQAAMTILEMINLIKHIKNNF